MSRDITTLLQMLQYRRPDKSKTERDFIERYIKPVAPNIDGYGNYYVAIGDNPTILWSSHTDTVHRGEGFQTPWYDNKDECIKLSPKGPTSTCLGADCGAGIFVMLEMIKAGVPGLYVFHRNEESGGGGSMFIAKEMTLLSGIQAAVAFDRKGKDSVITHQHGTRTCSDAFAKSLIEQINGYKIDTTGSFTDTASYKRIVPECTNLSVGYEGAHFSGESLHVPTLLRLRDTMLKIDATKFVIERDPSKADPFVSNRGWSYSRDFGDARGWNNYTSAARSGADTTRDDDRVSNRRRYGVYEQRTLLSLLIHRAYAVSQLFESWGMTYDDVVGYIEEMDAEKRTQWEDKFHNEHKNNIEKAFQKQLELQAREAEEQGPVQPEPATPSRGINGLTEEEWRAMEAESNAPAPTQSGTAELFLPKSEAEPIKLLPKPADA